MIDHSVQVDVTRSENAVQENMEKEFQRNKERFAFLKWGSKGFRNMLVVPPGSGIVHQVWEIKLKLLLRIRVVRILVSWIKRIVCHLKLLFHFNHRCIILKFIWKVLPLLPFPSFFEASLQTMTTDFLGYWIRLIWNILGVLFSTLMAHFILIV